MHAEWKQTVGYGVHTPMATMRIEVPEYASEGFARWYGVVKDEPWFEGERATMLIVTWLTAFEAGRQSVSP